MAVDAKVVYWTAALANMLTALGCAVAGVRRIRRGEVAAHQRAMKTAALLVVLFLISYLLKVEALGREQLELWEPRFVAVLRMHESFVAAMVIAGTLALALASGLGLVRIGRAVPAQRTLGARAHRVAGWTALASCALGVATAAYVLYGMYARLS
ncbi:MAG TPA: DUF420 domain-containing protein [Myxococcota bacterium]|nr:DUF420 domain-containing protein [Myxococcota bacterium]